MTALFDVLDTVFRKLESAWLMAFALLFARIAVFFPFYNSGLIKYNDWKNTGFSPDAFSITVYMFDPANGDDAVFAVPGLDPVLGAYSSMIGEMLLPFLVILGIAGRFGAAGLLVMTAVIQVAAPESWNHHMLWAGCLLFVFLKGPGLLSVDHFARMRFIGR